jgi:hypothetical protein
MTLKNCFFKYTARLDFLDNGLFRFTQRSQLNDPLECYPQILMETHAPEDIEEAKEQARKMGITSTEDMERWLPMFLEVAPKRRFTPEEFPGIPYPPGINSMAEMDRQNAEKRLQELLKHVDETYGIFCVTQSSDDFLMWSHYSDAHKGVVVCFDAEHEFFKNAHDFYPVEYSDQRISLSSNDGFLRLAGYVHSESRYKDLPVRLFLRKAKIWAREHEWRMIRKLEERDLFLPENPPIYLFKIPLQALKALILGAQIPPENADKIWKKVSTSADWPHVELFQASLAGSGYGVEIKPYKHF